MLRKRKRLLAGWAPGASAALEQRFGRASTGICEGASPYFRALSHTVHHQHVHPTARAGRSVLTRRYRAKEHEQP